jgi:putative heme-binding domain-containing protein
MKAATWLSACAFFLVVYPLEAADQDKFNAAKQPQVIPVWPKGAPGSEKWTQKEVEVVKDHKVMMVRNITRPTLTAFLPDRSTANGTAVVICPGGAFRFLSWESEGTAVAEWLRARGVAAFVLKYRLVDTGATDEEFRKAMAAMFRNLPNRNRPGNNGDGGKRPAVPPDMRKIAALASADGRQAIKVVRRHAAEWGISPDRIGIMGFSAGGMVTMGVVMDHDEDSRPNFAAPIYGGSVGGGKIPADAPPLFVLAANDDQMFSATSARLYSDWKAAGHPVELHIYSKGGHGFGMNKHGLPVDHWIDRFGEWLGQQGLLKAAHDDKLKPKAKAPTATAAESLKVLKDFKAELLYSVPKDKQGSWVNLCVDPKGRLITSDQYGPLYRITPPPLGGRAGDTKVEKLGIPVGEAHGLLWAFDSLYVVDNEGQKHRRGLYRVRSTDGGDTFDKPEFLHDFPQGGGEHGAHAVLLGPDGKSLYVVVGDMAKMIHPLAGSRVPKLWGEDHLLPRMPDGNGFMAGVLGPGGCIYKVDPDGKDWELISTGYRNAFDAAFNRYGDLFTYDADMEWDMNTPWYRPTRVCLAASGSEFGWRNGAGKWPPYYPDSLPAIYNVGPGSPTGMTFGYGARFPAKYQEALFMCDWSYGKLYALHLTPAGSAYKGELEEFVNGSPLPLTDVVINPKDGALYFTIGGRQTQSGLYRITYVGKEPTAPSQGGPAPGPLHALRRQLEAFHGRHDGRAVEAAWPYLGHDDRYIRFAARVAIEHQDPKTWQERALGERDPAKALNALLALVRATGQDPFHHPRKPADSVPGAALKGPILEALDRIDWHKLTDGQRLDVMRVYAVLFNRMGWPDRAARGRLIQRFDPLYPAKGRELNAELCQLLVYLEAPGVAAKTLKLLAAALTQEEQLEYAKSLRVLQTGWTPAQRAEYFAWYLKAANYKGGASLRGFLRIMKGDAVATLTAKEKAALRPVLEAEPVAATPVAGKHRPFVKQWKLDQLTLLVEKGLTKRDFDRGRRLFGEANCFACHRFDNEGGSQGPDLTIASGRFSVRDLLESILDPSKEISDQYAAVVISTIDGKVVTGRIVNYSGDHMSVMTDMLDPNGQVEVSAKKVDSIEKSKVSMMPTGLLDTFKEDEILDLVAYLLSRGDRKHKMFMK